MSKKQSSIEWLENQLRQKYLLLDFESVLRQAKAIHKQEMIEFSYKVLNESNDSFNGYVDEEKIYDETFGGE